MHLVFSCSNDTTIKLWSLKEVYDDPYNEMVKNLRSTFTLDEDYDYVRCIDYSI